MYPYNSGYKVLISPLVNKINLFLDKNKASFTKNRVLIYGWRGAHWAKLSNFAVART